MRLTPLIERRPFELRYPDGFRLAGRTVARAVASGDRIAWCARLGLSDRSALIGLLRTLKKSRWNIGNDRSITEWLHECGQTSQVVRRVWRPLALAALNTPLDRASAQIFANVLRDSLGARRALPAKCGCRAPIFRRCFPTRSSAMSWRTEVKFAAMRELSA